MRFRPLAPSKTLLGLAALGLMSCGLAACGGGSSTTPPPFNDVDTNFRITSVMTTGSLPEGMVNIPYTYSFETNAGQPEIQATLPVSFSAQNLPPGLTLSSEGVLSGTPQTPGVYSIIIDAVDSSPQPHTTGAAVSLQVAAPAVNLTQVAHLNLGGHGQNAGVTVARTSSGGAPFAYIGTRGTPGECPATGVKIVDLSSITNPQQVATVGGVPGSSQTRPFVLAGVSSPSFHSGAEGDLLAVPLQPCNPQTAASNEEGVEFYDVTNPAHPTLLGTWNSGVLGVSSVVMLEANQHLYALAAVPGSETQTGVSNPEGDLRVLDITDPASPREIGNWGLLKATGELVSQLFMGQDERVLLNTIHLSSDGKTAYLSYWDGGIVMLDVGNPAAVNSSNAGILLNQLQYPVTAQATTTTPSAPEGNTAFALPVAGGTQLLASDDVCATGTPANPALSVVCGPHNHATLTGTTGWGFLRTYGLNGPSSTTMGGFYATPASMSVTPPDGGIYTAHDIAWNGNSSDPHAYVAWYSNGVVDLDMSSVAQPVLLATFVPPDTADPNGTTPGVNNPAKALVYGVAAYRAQGQPYVLASDINSGLWILQETPTPGLSILTTSLPEGTMGVPYQASLSAVNGALGSSKISFSVSPASEDPLPPGLQLSSNGQISGTPAAADTYTVTFQANDSLGHTTQQTVTFTIDDNLAVLTPTVISASGALVSAIPIGTAREPYLLSLGAVNGTSPYTFSVASGRLPTGLSLSSDGVISGTPATAGVSNVVIEVTDSTVPALTATLPLSLQIEPLKVFSATLTDAVVGESYAFSVPMANGTGPYTPIVTSGALPPGVTATTGSSLGSWLLSGTPTQAGTYNFSVLVDDSLGQSATQTFTLVVNPYEATPLVLASGRVSYGYNQELSVQGGTSPYTFNLVLGTLPQGLSLNVQDGVISGVPASDSAGTYTFEIQIRDNNGLTADQDFSLSIYSGNNFAITTPLLPAAEVGVSYDQPIVADYGTTPYQMTITQGALPPGLSLSQNGVLSGTPSAAGSYTFQVQASDAAGERAVQNIRLTVDPANSPN